MFRAIHNAATMTVLVTGKLFEQVREIVPASELPQLIIDLFSVEPIGPPLGAQAMMTVDNVDPSMMGTDGYMLIVYSATGYPMQAVPSIMEARRNRLDSKWAKAVRFTCDIEWSSIIFDLDAYDAEMATDLALDNVAKLVKLHYPT
jgi:hypothetical protein